MPKTVIDSEITVLSPTGKVIKAFPDKSKFGEQFKRKHLFNIQFRQYWIKV